MLKKLLIITITAQLLSTYSSKAMVKGKSYSIILPGLGETPGRGGFAFENYHIVNTSKDATVRFTTLASPWYKIDLGQDNCIQDFEKQLHEPPYKNNKHYFYGISQGTATLFNWLGKMSHEEQEKNAHCLVLESVLGSGDSAILHTIESAASLKNEQMPYTVRFILSLATSTTYFPFARAWLPLAAKIAFPTYNPFGKQAVTSAKKISPNIPVIIMHNHADPQLSINDAREVYCSLRENGHKGAYLFEIECTEPAHVSILHYDKNIEKSILSLQAIYRKHKLPYREIEGIDKIELEGFKPSAQEVRKKIYDSTWKKRWIRNTIDITATGMLVGYLAYRYKN
ncbi:MAG: hypothetical protein WC707_05640 [Candidatus Babeliaceae bacterium]|jgi:hypothetical protein